MLSEWLCVYRDNGLLFYQGSVSSKTGGRESGVLQIAKRNYF